MTGLLILAGTGVILGAINSIQIALWTVTALGRRRENRAAVKRLAHGERRQVARFRGVLHDDVYIADQVTRWGGRR